MNQPQRVAEQARTSAETAINLRLNLDGTGKTQVNTGFGLLDHMLTLTAFWAGMDLRLDCKGDLQVDAHHTAEDVGLTLGKALLEALGDRVGIARVGYGRVPMDEALAEVTVDLSGRPWLEWRGGELLPPVLAGEEKDLWREYYKALASAARCNLHVEFRYGQNGHHLLESVARVWALAWPRPYGNTAQLSEAPREVLTDARPHPFPIYSGPLPGPGALRLQPPSAQHGRGTPFSSGGLCRQRGALYAAPQRQPAHCGTHP